MEMQLEQISRMTRDIRVAAQTLTTEQARFLVDAYYTMQDNRRRAENQVRALEKSGEPNLVMKWLEDQNSTLEKQIAGALEKYTAAHPMGAWMRGIVGIGPVIAAGFLAHLDITKAQTAGAFWKYCGITPGQERKKGEKISWNPALKRLCWLAGESFVKVSGHDDAFFGKRYMEKKEYYNKKNEEGGFKARAEECLKNKKYGDDTTALKFYKKGMLPPAHIHSMAKRSAVTLFLALLFEEWYRLHYQKEPPNPYPLEHLGHVHRIDIPTPHKSKPYTKYDHAKAAVKRKRPKP